MNIKILDSWLRDYLKTNVKPKEIAELLSLSSVSVEKLEKSGEDWVYEIEVTTNRVDLMSILGLSKEISAVLSQNEKKAEILSFEPQSFKTSNQDSMIEIVNNEDLVYRICAAVLEVKIGDSPKEISERLESSGIRSINNLVDITNYIMRETGHPAHVFDYDRLKPKKLIVRQAKKGEKVVTLDGLMHELEGGDIVADNGEGKIIDLLGVMGTQNSVVTENTRRILLFIDNNNPQRIRKTSMEQGIRTEAAILNEKGVDRELALKTLFRGIELYEKIADAKLISGAIDIYPKKLKQKEVPITQAKTEKILGVPIQEEEISRILKSLDFKVEKKGAELRALIPSQRYDDINIEEDLIEEVARIKGYHTLPSIVPPGVSSHRFDTDSTFYWEGRIKEALKYWGFVEVYTYSFVSKDIFEGPEEDALEIQNPLNEEMVLMRKTLVPSLLKVAFDNKGRELSIFEISNVYIKRENELPKETLKLSGVVKKQKADFFEVKGILEQLFRDLGIGNVKFREKNSGIGAQISINGKSIGEIEVLDNSLTDFELDFEEIVKNATTKKTYTPISKYPPFIEDMSFSFEGSAGYEEVSESIKSIDSLIKEVTLLDEYGESKTFRITYQSEEKNLSKDEIEKIREKIVEKIGDKFRAKLR